MITHTMHFEKWQNLTKDRLYAFEEDQKYVLKARNSLSS